MTATDELRALLDERGVEWSSIGGDTAWEDSRGWTATAEADSVDGSMVYVTALMTPEQAIEATLGPREQPPYDELIEALRRDWDIEASWDGLRRFWYVGLTDEGVRKRDEREATLGRGTCRMPRVEDEERILHGWMECSECGPVYPPAAERIQDAVKFCPFCGRGAVGA